MKIACLILLKFGASTSTEKYFLLIYYLNLQIIFSVSKGWVTYQFLYALSNLYLIVLLIRFFIFFCVLQQKIVPNWRNYLFQLQNQAEHNTRNIQTAPGYLLATGIMWVIFWTERDLCIIFWLQEFIQQQKLINKQKIPLT